MNPGILILVTAAISVGAIIIVALVWTALGVIRLEQGTTPTSALQPCSTTANRTSLLIPPDSAACVQNGTTGGLYYVGHLGDKSYDYVVAPYPTSNLDVCVSYCTTYSNGICTGPAINGKSAQSNYESCMAQLSHSDCVPPAPIAIRGNTLYYPYAVTASLCENASSM
jgi:hypothetical protein